LIALERRGAAQAAAESHSESAVPEFVRNRHLVGRTLAEVERIVILETLDACGGNRTRAARVLGISIRTLRNRLKGYAVEGASVPHARAAANAPPNEGLRKCG
jgi:DNA-binding NtrC family response regulator